MARVNDAREWARRAMLSVLAGGGLTAVGLGGSLASGALGAELPSATTGTSATPGAEVPTQTTSAPPPATTTTTAGEPTATPAPVTTSTPTAPSTSASAPAPSSTPTSTVEVTPPPAPAPKVVHQHTQQTTEGQDTKLTTTSASGTPKPTTPATSGNIAPAPQLAAAQAEALAAMLAGSAASIRALDFYQIPLFLLPIYQSAAVKYGVPWPILAAINEVETDYGTDQSVSTAGAIGWMQFMPETWLQYGVDAVNSGYADPYNPVDAIFAAARYLHAAGASKNLHAAILAYNHSEAYVESVLLRARLIASYPASVIATLTGLTEGILPVTDAKLSPGSNIPQGVAPAPASTSSATAGATPEQPTATSAKQDKQPSATLPGSTPAPSPAASAARAERSLNAPAPPSQLSRLLGAKNAPVLAVEDGRVVDIGTSRRLGHYLVLRDTYGDVFTYGGLGSIAPGYRLPKPTQIQVPKGALAESEGSSDPKPTKAASAGRQLPLTLHVAKPKVPAASKHSGPRPAAGTVNPLIAADTGKVRVYAHPGNPDAVAAAHARAARQDAKTAGWMKLERGSVVAQGTVLGHLGAGAGGTDPSLRFAIRPSGAQGAVDPRPIFENWRQLSVALHPQGAKNGAVLTGATASDAFLLSQDELERAVLADPDIKLGACDRAQVASGKVQGRVLALLVFLSRSGLKPTVGRLRCGRTAYTARGSVTALYAGDSVELTAINDIPIAGHQGAGTITDITIRTLLTLQHKYAPKRIISLMKYPDAPSTLAKSNRASYIEVDLPKHNRLKTPANAGATSTRLGRAAASQHSATVPLAANVALNSVEWQQLIGQIGSLPAPKVSRTPSSSAIRKK